MNLRWYRDKLLNVDKDHFRQWHSGRYLVRWRDQYAGVNIQAGYHALVLTKTSDGKTMLDFVWRYKIFRTRKSAMQACEDHAAGLNPAAMAKQRKIDKK